MENQGLIQIQGKKVRAYRIGKEYHRIRQKALEEYLLLQHLASGAPARASELQVLLLAGTDIASRNIFLQGDTLVILQKYGKTGYRTQQDANILRFLPPSITRLFIVFFGLLTPLSAMIVLQKDEAEDNEESEEDNDIELDDSANDFEEKAEDEDMQLDKYFLFVNTMTGKLLSQQSIRRIIPRKTKELLGQGISLSNYRQAVSALMDYNLPSAESSILVKTAQKQMGHSLLTHNQHYGLSNAAPTVVSRDSYQKSKEVSAGFWVLLGLLQKEKIHATDPVSVPGPALPLAPAGQIKASNYISKASVGKFNDERDKPLQFGAEAAARALACTRSLVPGFINYLEKQGQILPALIQGLVDDMLVVSKTGSGKTLYWTVTTACTGKTSVVIVPTVSLLTEQLIRSNASGLVTRRFSDLVDASQYSTCNIIFCHVNDALKENFRGVLLTLANSGRLGYIFLDEAHILVKWKAWHEGVDKIPFLRHLKVPLVFLTATAPPEVVAGITHTFNTRSLTVIRSSSNVPGIRLKVVHADSLYSATETLIHKCSGKIIIFVASVAEADKFFKELPDRDSEDRVNAARDRFVYHGQMSDNEKDQAYKDFNKSKNAILFATTAWAMGMNSADVKLVIHLRTFFSLIDLAQASGRIRGTGTSVVIVNEESISNLRRTVERKGDMNAIRALEYLQTDFCRRNALFGYLDDAPTFCATNTDNVLCDNCSASDDSLLIFSGSGEKFTPPRIKERVSTSSYDAMPSRSKTGTHYNVITY